MEAKQFHPLKLQPKQRIQESRSTGKVQEARAAGQPFPPNQSHFWRNETAPKERTTDHLVFSILAPKEPGKLL